MQVETKIMQVVRSVLSHFGNKYIDTNGTLKRNKVIEDLDHYDKDLMSALLANKMIHDQYTKKIADTVVFELNKFIDVFESPFVKLSQKNRKAICGRLLNTPKQKKGNHK